MCPGEEADLIDVDTDKKFRGGGGGGGSGGGGGGGGFTAPAAAMHMPMPMPMPMHMPMPTAFNYPPPNAAVRDSSITLYIVDQPWSAVTFVKIIRMYDIILINLKTSN